MALFIHSFIHSFSVGYQWWWWYVLSPSPFFLAPFIFVRTHTQNTKEKLDNLWGLPKVELMVYPLWFFFCFVSDTLYLGDTLHDNVRCFYHHHHFHNISVITHCFPPLHWIPNTNIMPFWRLLSSYTEASSKCNLALATITTRIALDCAFISLLSYLLSCIALQAIWSTRSGGQSVCDTHKLVCTVQTNWTKQSTCMRWMRMVFVCKPRLHFLSLFFHFLWSPPAIGWQQIFLLDRHGVLYLSSYGNRIRSCVCVCVCTMRLPDAVRYWNTLCVWKPHLCFLFHFCEKVTFCRKLMNLFVFVLAQHARLREKRKRKRRSTCDS